MPTKPVHSDAIEETRRAIHRKLSVRPLTAGEIAEALDIEIPIIASCLRVMQKDGCVDHFVVGALIKWRII